jgi:glyoxylase-like metal-dependent hydrolase (beta-lactamase superfamily II)
MQAEIHPFHDAETGSYSYVVACTRTRRAAIIDPVLDYDPRSARIGTKSVEAIATCVREHALGIDWILETHAHADHLSAAAVLKGRFGGRIGIGQGVREVQATFRDILDLGHEFPVDGSQFDRLFADDESFSIGELAVRVLATPGHTSDSITYLVGDAAFIGDTLFAPDYGTARCDFPGGDARELYRSVQRLYALPPETHLYQCHDYPPAHRAPRPAATVGEQREGNVMLSASTSMEHFVAARKARDAKLAAPVLIIPAIQINIRAGSLPPPASNGRSYLKVPVNTL